jgi:hypothetical protein
MVLTGGGDPCSVLSAASSSPYSSPATLRRALPRVALRLVAISARWRENELSSPDFVARRCREIRIRLVGVALLFP